MMVGGLLFDYGSDGVETAAAYAVKWSTTSAEAAAVAVDPNVVQIAW